MIEKLFLRLVTSYVKLDTLTLSHVLLLIEMSLKVMVPGYFHFKIKGFSNTFWDKNEV